jgi:hypothetical protein
MRIDHSAYRNTVPQPANILTDTIHNFPPDTRAKPDSTRRRIVTPGQEHWRISSASWWLIGKAGNPALGLLHLHVSQYGAVWQGVRTRSSSLGQELYKQELTGWAQYIRSLWRYPPSASLTIVGTLLGCRPVCYFWLSFIPWRVRQATAASVCRTNSRQRNVTRQIGSSRYGIQ